MTKIKRPSVVTVVFTIVVGLFSGGVTGQSIIVESARLVSGGYLIGKVPLETTVSFNEKSVPVDKEGYFIIGFSREQAGLHEIVAKKPDGELSVEAIWIELREFDEQRIVGVDQSKITPPKSVLDRISREYQLVVNAKNKVTDAIAWREEFFVWPIFSRKTGHYGSQRFYNGQAGNPHWGVDLAAKTGTPVYAPASGRVTLAETDLYFSGGTVIIDHGQKLTSSFLHLSKLSVRTGQWIRQGDLLGYVGSTGRSTGPHLDWRMSMRGVRIDAELWVPDLATLCIDSNSACEPPVGVSETELVRWRYNREALLSR
ncbi:M23 family metallopeptidase [Reinekea forsetii]|nr:M23 family metallopeptidase [Reinekea forsetii]